MHLLYLESNKLIKWNAHIGLLLFYHMSDDNMRKIGVDHPHKSQKAGQLKNLYKLALWSLADQTHHQRKKLSKAKAWEFFQKSACLLGLPGNSVRDFGDREGIAEQRGTYMFFFFPP